MEYKTLPIGVENFEEFITEEHYYVDKTMFIKELLDKKAEVNLFTRPRRFGKTLTLSMLKYFFEDARDAQGNKKDNRYLFEGLKIMETGERYLRHMGHYPVIFITLKCVDAMNYQDARNALCDLIGDAALRFQFLYESENLSDEEKEIYSQLIAVNPPAADPDKKPAIYAMSDAELAQSLQTLSALLCRHYGRKVILLIDEYDVPLDKAFQSGYYDEMVCLIRNVFSNVLKTNDSLQFAVLTGCLRISKESIFTGLNNFNVLSVVNVQFDGYFGFTDTDVKELLAYYGLSEHYGTVKEWYDGYQFGNVSVYCPWNVICYCDTLRSDPEAFPEDYWSNTSSNSIVRRFIDKADMNTKNEIERLISGETIVKEIRQDLTYNELDNTIENLWSVLFTTGYLTHRGREDGKKFRLAIPNHEIRELFVEQINKWFTETTRNDTPKLDAFCAAFPKGDAETIEQLLNDYLWNTISIRDTAVPQEQKENFYHGIVLGLLSHKENWLMLSNAESGVGYSDILVEVPESRTGVVIEMKYAKDGKLDEGCAEALRQIDKKQYDARLQLDGMKNIVKVGIACFRKYCKVVCR